MQGPLELFVVLHAVDLEDFFDLGSENGVGIREIRDGAEKFRLRKYSDLEECLLFFHWFRGNTLY